MLRCASLLEEHVDVDFVDINCGCPIDLICAKWATPDPPLPYPTHPTPLQPTPGKEQLPGVTGVRMPTASV